MEVLNIDSLFKLTDNLTDAIKKSKYYNDYIISKENIKKNPELHKEVADFKKIHMDFQRRKNNGDNISFDYEKSVSKKYHTLILNKDVKMFFENEQALIKLLGEIYNRITSECTIELDI